MPNVRKLPETKVQTVDVGRCIAANGVTFFATFNRADKTCGVSIGENHSIDPDHRTEFVVSYPSIRAFAKLILKHAKEV